MWFSLIMVPRGRVCFCFLPFFLLDVMQLYIYMHATFCWRWSFQAFQLFLLNASFTSSQAVNWSKFWAFLPLCFRIKLLCFGSIYVLVQFFLLLLPKQISSVRLVKLIFLLFQLSYFPPFPFISYVQHSAVSVFCISFWQPKRAGNADGINWIVTAFLYVLPLRKLVPLDSTVGQGYSAMYRNSVSWVLKITVQLYFLLPLYLLQRLRISQFS